MTMPGTSFGLRLPSRISRDTVPTTDCTDGDGGGEKKWNRRVGTDAD